MLLQPRRKLAFLGGGAFQTPAAAATVPVPQEVPAPVPLRKFGDGRATRQRVFDSIYKTIQQIPDVSNNTHTLRLTNPQWMDPDHYSKADVKRALIGGQTLGRRLQGTWELMDNATGKVLDSRRQVVLRAPYITDDNTLVHRGNSYLIQHQQRLRPGIYTRRKANQEIESHFNILPHEGVPHRYTLDPEKGTLNMQIAKTNVPLVPVLRALGASDKEIRAAWGDAVFDANNRRDDIVVMKKLSDKLLAKEAPADPRQAAQAVVERIRQFKFDPEVNKVTLGQPFQHVDKDAVLAATQKMLKVFRGEAEADSRDSLPFQRFLGPEQLLQERLQLDHSNLRRQLLFKAAKANNLGKNPSGALTPQLEQLLLGSGLGLTVEEINPLEILDKATRVTRMGEGALENVDTIPDEARHVSAGQMGFVDTVRTTESLRAGVDTFFARGARLGDDGQLYGRFLNRKTGQTEWKTPKDMADVAVAIPGELRRRKMPRVAAVQSGKIVWRKPEEIQYEMQHFEDAFSPLGNLVAMKSAAKSHRMAMASRMMTQALPSPNAEAPLVRNAVPGQPGGSFEREYGSHFGAIRSEKAGKVVAVAPDKITMRYEDGTTQDVELDVNRPYARKSVTGSTVIYVKRAGEVCRTRIADYTWQSGDLTLSIDPATCRSAWLPIKQFICHKNDKQLLLVRTESGRQVTVTEDHSLITLGDAGELVPVYPAECVVGVTRCPIALLEAAPLRCNPLNYAERDDYRRGVLAGLYLAEGHCSAQPGNVQIATSDKKRAKQIVKLCETLGIEASFSKDKTQCVQFTDYVVRAALLRDFGHLAHNKRIPDSVFSRSQFYRIGLVQGYMAGDGCLWSSRDSLSMCAVSVSQELRDGLMDVLSSLGVLTTKWEAPRQHLNKNWRNGYGFRVVNDYVNRLDRWFFYADREAALRKIHKKKYRSSKYGLIPVSKKSRKLLYQSIKADDYLQKTARQGAVAKHRVITAKGVFGKWGRSDVAWDTIVAIEAVQHEEFVYDLSVAVSEVFASEHGLIVHNTLFNQTPTVQPGDTVPAGGLLAKSNYTDAQGDAAVGFNTRVAYMPWHNSVAGDTHVLWYQDGIPVFDEIRKFRSQAGNEAFAVSQTALTSQLREVQGFCSHPAVEVLSIKTSSGRRLRATPAHSFVVLSDLGELQEVLGSDLIEGKSIVPRLGSVALPVRNREIYLPRSSRKPGTTISLDYDFGVLCGLYIAEGHVPSGKSCIQFAATDKKTRAAIKEIVERLFPETVVTAKHDNAVLVFDSRLAGWLRQEGGHLAANKKIPNCAFASPIEFRRGLIAGFWTGDGCVHDKGKSQQTDTRITSRQLRDGLGLLLASLGISTQHSDYEDDRCRGGMVYRLAVSCRDAHKLPDIRRLHTTKGDRLLRVINSYQESGQADCVPLPSQFIAELKGVIKKVYSASSKDYKRCQAALTRGNSINRKDLRRLAEAIDNKQLLILANSALEWDVVESVRSEAYDDWVFDFDMTPDNTFVCVDTLVVHNSNFKDAVVISESYAKRTSSEHAYQYGLDDHKSVQRGKKVHSSIFAGKFGKEAMDKLDDNGVVKPGSVVEFGDPLILAVAERQDAKNRVYRQGQKNFVDRSLTWDHNTPGEVTDVVDGDNGPAVVVKTLAPTRVGDKVSGRMGDKGVVSRIVPDHLMPHDAQGKPFELLLSPLGTISRANASQQHEALLGKVAALTGKPITVEDFGDITDLGAHAVRLARQHGISLKEAVTNPEDGSVLQVGTGNRFIMKLHHTSDSKAQGRGSGGYSSDDSPSKGGAAGCFIGSTLVDTPFGPRTLKELFLSRDNDLVLTRKPDDPSGLVQEGKVTARFAYTVLQNQLVSVCLSNGQTLHCTRDHRFVTLEGGKVEAEKLTPGTRLQEVVRYEKCVRKGCANAAETGRCRKSACCTAGTCAHCRCDFSTCGSGGSRNISPADSGLAEPNSQQHYTPVVPEIHSSIHGPASGSGVYVVSVQPFSAEPVPIPVYDLEVSPTHFYSVGGVLVSNSKRISLLDANALLSHGGYENLRDAGILRGQRNDDYWLQFMQGHTPPEPKVPKVYEDFVNKLKGAGINVVRDNHRLHLMAMTNADIEELAGDREITVNDTVRGNSLDPVPGGLFDPKLTGSHGGKQWAYIRLPEPVPSPAFEEPIRRLLGLTQKQFRDVLSGQEKFRGHTGPAAIGRALNQIDVDRDLEAARETIHSNRGQKRDAAIRRLRYLKAAQATGIKPKDWMLDKVPVLPPAFRPISMMGNSGIPLVADANLLYKELMDARDSLSGMRESVGEEGIGPERLAVYDAFKAVTGLGNPVTRRSQEKGLQGLLGSVFGNSPKYSIMQRKLLSTNVDNVGRGVIVPDPDLDMDQLGIPEEQAFATYGRFIVRRMVRSGMPLPQAIKAVRDRTEQARRALTEEMQERPVLANRAPVLHKFGIMAFRPHLVAGDAIQINPLVTKGLNADFDGDTMQFHLPSTDKAVQEAYERLLPSKSLISPADLRSPSAPFEEEFVAGLYEATRETDEDDKKKPPKIYLTQDDAMAAIQRGEVKLSDVIKILKD